MTLNDHRSELIAYRIWADGNGYLPNVITSIVALLDEVQDLKAEVERLESQLKDVSRGRVL